MILLLVNVVEHQKLVTWQEGSYKGIFPRTSQHVYNNAIQSQRISESQYAEEGVQNYNF